MTLRDIARLHAELTRRYFLRLGAVGGAFLARGTARAEPTDDALARRIAEIEPYFTPAPEFRDVSRGTPLPHSLSDDTKREVGLTRETWRLEVVSDPESPCKVGNRLTRADNTALDFAGLMKIADTRSVRFAKIMTCLNVPRPLGMGLWEGVPLRDIVWLAEPREDFRRVFYYGYHHDDPKQLFRSSLPVARVLEDPFDLPPVIVCYKLNGEWLDSVRGGPVRIVVPEDYGFKSIKWLSHVVLSNLPHANDTYANGNNDLDSPLKTFSAVLTMPEAVRAGEPIPITGYAQVGMGGLAKVQVSVERDGPTEGREPAGAWRDADLLEPPDDWGAVPGGKVPKDTIGFEPESGRPRSWPMRWTRAHWATLLPPMTAGEYILKSRTVDSRGSVQPMPRPFRKSGHAAIEERSFTVK